MTRKTCKLQVLFVKPRRRIHRSLHKRKLYQFWKRANEEKSNLHACPRNIWWLLGKFAFDVTRKTCKLQVLFVKPRSRIHRSLHKRKLYQFWKRANEEKSNLRACPRNIWWLLCKFAFDVISSFIHSIEAFNVKRDILVRGKKFSRGCLWSWKWILNLKIKEKKTWWKFLPCSFGLYNWLVYWTSIPHKWLDRAERFFKHNFADQFLIINV